MTVIMEIEPKQETVTLEKPTRSARNTWMIGLLIVVTIIWGGTFLVVQNTIKLTGPFTFLTLRFGILSLIHI